MPNKLSQSLSKKIESESGMKKGKSDYIEFVRDGHQILAMLS